MARHSWSGAEASRRKSLRHALRVNSAARKGHFNAARPDPIRRVDSAGSGRSAPRPRCLARQRQAGTGEGPTSGLDRRCWSAQRATASGPAGPTPQPSLRVDRAGAEPLAPAQRRAAEFRTQAADRRAPALAPRSRSILLHGRAPTPPPRASRAAPSPPGPRRRGRGAPLVTPCARTRDPARLRRAGSGEPPRRRGPVARPLPRQPRGFAPAPAGSSSHSARSGPASILEGRRASGTHTDVVQHTRECSAFSPPFGPSLVMVGAPPFRRRTTYEQEQIPARRAAWFVLLGSLR